MSFRPTIVVLIMAVIGVVAAIVVRHGERPGAAAAEGLIEAVRGIPVQRVDGIALRRDRGQAMVFERTANGWQQVEPFRHPMEAYSIRQLPLLAAQLAFLKQLGSAELGAEAVADLWLRPPMAVLSLRWPRGTVTIEFGRRGVAGRSYLRIAGNDTVYVVNSRLYERAVEMDPREWRSRTIFESVGVDSDEVVIAEGQRRTVLRRDRKQWRIVEPVATRLDPPARDELFGALGRARSGGFILDEPRDPASFGLKEPVASLTVTSTRLVQGAEGIQRHTIQQRLLVGAPMGVAARDRFGLIEDRPVVVKLPEAVLRDFFPSLQSLIDPTASGTNAADVVSLIIHTADGELRLTRDLDQWSAGAQESDVSAVLVGDLLDLLTTRRASEIQIKPYPKELEVATIILQGPHGRPLDTVRIVREPATGRWGLENGDGVLRIFSAQVEIRLTPGDFGL